MKAAGTENSRDTAAMAVSPPTEMTLSLSSVRMGVLVVREPSRPSSNPRAKLVAPLCRYTGVTRKVPLSSAPKIGKRCPMGTEKVSCPEGKQKPRKQRNKI